MVEDIGLENLQKSIQIEEETRNRDKSVPSKDSSKVHTMEACSKYKRNFKVKNDRGKFKKNKSNNKEKNANGNCFHCGKPGHYIRDCRHRKFNVQNDNKTNDANIVEESGVDIVAMVSMMHNGMMTELNMAVRITSSGWWLDSGATIHVCNDKTQYKTYEAQMMIKWF
ncbi:hypothetical protein LWI28_002803 [Acer negundo]|uniref:CCHC-type domain-containing protein n=1 Tax=Acer negundo TaxID=4023 RepID=A0AAD5ITD8_ACENE|nr:hypothetical protein LWI28_002803 [Acer negundo]